MKWSIKVVFLPGIEAAVGKSAGPNHGSFQVMIFFASFG